jgi:glycosyltransferase involved in cell wall biosynthesis
MGFPHARTQRLTAAGTRDAKLNTDLRAATAKRDVRLLGNLPPHLCNASEFAAAGVSYERIPDSGTVGAYSLGDLLRIIRNAARFDGLLFFQNEPQLLRLCALKIATGARLKIISIDLISMRPTHPMDHLKALVKKFLYRQVDLFLLHLKESEGYRRFLGIDSDRLRYVPYIVKDRHEVERQRNKLRADYILSCGRSRRDYRCLIDAVRGLDYPVRILAPRDRDLAIHRSDPLEALATLSPNVQIVHDDGTYASWVSFIAGCRMLVLPLNASAMYAEGIGSYLTAMAMHKAVVITATDAVKGVIDQGEAVLVPPGDSRALRAVLVELWENADFRQIVSDRGYAHAQRSGGEKELQRNILHETVAFLADRA